MASSRAATLTAVPEDVASLDYYVGEVNPTSDVRFSACALIEGFLQSHGTTNHLGWALLKTSTGRADRRDSSRRLVRSERVADAGLFGA